MDITTYDIARIVLIGIGATAVMDAWLLLLGRMGIPTMNFALLGRWAGHALRGRWMHDAIAKAPPVRHEPALGWLVHHAVGVAFAAVLVALQGVAWMKAPSLAPALLVGIATVAAPLFVLQPAMGAGIASRRTPMPAKNVMRSIANHTIFGAGLYLAAACIEWISR